MLAANARKKQRSSDMGEEKDSATTAETLRAHVRGLWPRHNRPYYIDEELYMQLWDEHVQKYGFKCSVTGEAFDMTKKATRPSVDQISAGSGYWAWNIRFTTCVFNTARNMTGDAHFEQMCRAVLESKYAQPCVHVSSA